MGTIESDFAGNLGMSVWRMSRSESHCTRARRPIFHYTHSTALAMAEQSSNQTMDSESNDGSNTNSSSLFLYKPGTDWIDISIPRKMLTIYDIDRGGNLT
jgi:hypothetical protein